MNIQTGKVQLPSDGTASARSDPASRANAGSEQVAVPPPVISHAAQPARPDGQSRIDAAKQIASQINDYLESASSSLQFMVDKESNRVVIKVVDTQTQEVIRQMPTEEMLAISKSLDRLSGLLIQQEA